MDIELRNPDGSPTDEAVWISHAIVSLGLAALTHYYFHDPKLTLAVAVLAPVIHHALDAPLADQIVKFA